MESWPAPNVLPSGRGWGCRHGAVERQTLCAGRFGEAAVATTAAREPCDANAKGSGCNAARLQDITSRKTPQLTDYHLMFSSRNKIQKGNLHQFHQHRLYLLPAILEVHAPEYVETDAMYLCPPNALDFTIASKFIGFPKGKYV